MTVTSRQKTLTFVLHLFINKLNYTLLLFHNLPTSLHLLQSATTINKTQILFSLSSAALQLQEMESWESSLSSDVTTTPNKKHPHSLSSTSAIPMISTPEPRQIRIAKPAFASGFDLPQLSYGVCESGMFQEFQKCPSRLPQK